MDVPALRRAHATWLLAASLIAGVTCGGPAVASRRQAPPAAAVRQALAAARDEARALAANGLAPSVPTAALRARDLALTLEDTLDTLPAAARLRVAGAIRAIVLSAWRLDAAGTAGDLAQIDHALGRFSAAVAVIEQALPAEAPGATALSVLTPGSTATPDFARQVQPILRARCAECHDRFGPTDALAAAQAQYAAPAIRDQLLREAMPPWFVDPEGPPVAGARTMSARELDTLLRWASQATAGGPAPVTAATVEPATFGAGTPTRIVDVPATRLEPGRAGTRASLTIPSGLTEDAWVRVVDVLPSDSSLLRAARVSIEGGPVVAAWFVGETPVSAPSGSAFRIPAGATLKVELHFRPLPPGSAARNVTARLGLYPEAAPASGRGLVARVFDDALTLDADARVVAVRVTQAEPLETVDIVATTPSGQSASVLRLRSPYPGWDRRYWLTTPVPLPRGSSLSVHVSGENPSVEVLLDETPTP